MGRAKFHSNRYFQNFHLYSCVIFKFWKNFIFFRNITVKCFAEILNRAKHFSLAAKSKERPKQNSQLCPIANVVNSYSASFWRSASANLLCVQCTCLLFYGKCIFLQSCTPLGMYQIMSPILQGLDYVIDFYVISSVPHLCTI